MHASLETCIYKSNGVVAHSAIIFYVFCLLLFNKMFTLAYQK